VDSECVLLGLPLSYSAQGDRCRKLIASGWEALTEANGSSVGCWRSHDEMLKTARAKSW
jgi:hypothetical protein